MSKTELIINTTLPETRIALIEDNEIQELLIERDSDRGVVGNIYKGRVIRVLPGMQAAFVDIGLEKAAFLYVDDICFHDFSTPLATNPLPNVASVFPQGHKPQKKIHVRPLKKVVVPVPHSPHTPEAHAMLQQEYGRQMVDDDFAQETPKPVSVTSSVKPQDSLEESLTSAASPLAIDEEDKETSEVVESAAIYRTEPLIDEKAWEEDVASDQDVVDVNDSEPQAEDLRDANPTQYNEEVEEELSVRFPQRRIRRERASIDQLVKEGQEILVQVAKEPIGTKGARLTCHISLPGRYLVFMPTIDHIGVSRRIDGELERRRLKETMAVIRPSGTGVIVRTASGKQTDKKLKADLDYLVSTWNEIQKKYNKNKTPSVVYQDLTIVLRAIRDMFTDEVDKVVVDSKKEHKSIMKFVLRFMPQMKDQVELYSGSVPIFDYYGIDQEISKALERRVWLKSGGYIVIDQAEAFVAIDVNTGRYVGKKNLEETILKTNLEAVKEIAYQLRLRNSGGIIILDLIDMEKESNREKVYECLEDALKKDRARPTIMRISQLGLIEMTRKRTRDSLLRSLCEPCSYCQGKSFIKNKITVAYDILRDIERESSNKDIQAISIQCHPSVADALLEEKSDILENLEHQYEKKISIRANGAYHSEQYEIVLHRLDGKNMAFTSVERQQMTRQKIQESRKKIEEAAKQKPPQAPQKKASVFSVDEQDPSEPLRDEGGKPSTEYSEQPELNQEGGATEVNVGSESDAAEENKQEDALPKKRIIAVKLDRHPRIASQAPQRHRPERANATKFIKRNVDGAEQPERRWSEGSNVKRDGVKRFNDYRPRRHSSVEGFTGRRSDTMQGKTTLTSHALRRKPYRAAGYVNRYDRVAPRSARSNERNVNVDEMKRSRAELTERSNIHSGNVRNPERIRVELLPRAPGNEQRSRFGRTSRGREMPYQRQESKASSVQGRHSLSGARGDYHSRRPGRMQTYYLQHQGIDESYEASPEDLQSEHDVSPKGEHSSDGHATESNANQSSHPTPRWRDEKGFELVEPPHTSDRLENQNSTDEDEVKRSNERNADEVKRSNDDSGDKDGE